MHGMIQVNNSCSIRALQVQISPVQNVTKCSLHQPTAYVQVPFKTKLHPTNFKLFIHSGNV